MIITHMTQLMTHKKDMIIHYYIVATKPHTCLKLMTIISVNMVVTTLNSQEKLTLTHALHDL